MEELAEGLSFVERYPGRAVVSVDTDKMAVSAAVAYLAGLVEVSDLNVESATMDDIVVGLYREYKI
jgi:ABC-2 type transport system ATP-binding protein